MIVGFFAQKALDNIKLGDRVTVNFPALPGRVYDSEVLRFVSGIREGQVLASGQLESVLPERMVRTFPVVLSLPEDFPPELRKVGLAANATIMTERAGAIAILALLTQWIETSLDAVL